MEDNFLDDPISTASVITDTFLEDQRRGMDFTSANEIATSTVMLTAPQNLEEAHDTIVNELVSNGASPSVDQLRSVIKQGKKNELRQAVMSKLSDVTVPFETKEELRGLLIESEQEDLYNNVNLEREMLKAYAEDSVARAESEVETQRAAMYVDNVDAIADIHSQISMSAEEAVNQIAMGTSNLSVFGDVLKLLIPGELGLSYKAVSDTFFGEDSSYVKVVVPGEYRTKFQKYFDSLPPEKIYPEVQRFLKTVVDTEGFFGSNAIEKVNLIEGALNGIIGDRSPTDFKWGRLLENVFGVLDAFAVTGAARKAVVGAGKSLGILPKLSVVNPKVATTLTTEAIKSEKVASSLGTTPEATYAATMLPSNEGFDDAIRIARVSDTKVGASLKGEPADIAQQLLDNQNSTYAFTTPEVRKQVLDNMLTGLADNEHATLYSNYSVMGDAALKVGADGASFKGVFGKANMGYSSFIEAVGAAKKGFPKDTAKILVSSPETGGILKYVDEVPEISKGEYFFEINRSAYWDELPSLMELGKVTHFGSATEYILDYQSIFSKLQVDGINRIKDYQDVALNKLHKVFEPAKNYVQKSDKHMEALINANMKTMELGRRLSKSELEGMGITDEAGWKAYEAFGDAGDVKHVLDNNLAYNKLRKAGWDKQIYHAETEFAQPGKVFDNVPTEDISTVYDVANKTFRSISKEEIAKLYADGHRLAKLQSAVTKTIRGADKTAFVEGTDIVLLKKGGKVLAKELPKDVLGYIHGYLGKRTFQGPYYIVEIIENARINGRVPKSGSFTGHVRAIHAAETKGKAEAAVAKLMEKAEPGVRYDWRYDKAIESGESEFLRASLESERGTALKFRGKGLSSVDSLLGNEHGIDTMAEIQHPMKAIENGIAATAKYNTHYRYLESTKQAWLNKYKDLVPDGKYPIHEGFIVGPKSSRLKEAKAAFRSIERLDGIEDKVGKSARDAMITFSEWLGDKKLAFITNRFPALEEPLKFPKLSEYVISHKDINPLQTMRSINFFKFIASDPIKQWFLQPSQLAFTAGIAPKYVFSGKLIKEMNFAHMGLLLKNMPETSILRKAMPSMSTLAKGFGVSEREFTNILKAMEDSGVLYTDSHAFLKNASYKNMSDLYQSSVDRNMAKIANNFKRVHHMFTKVGFNPAEKVNMMGHWLIARNRVLEKSPNLIAGSRAFTDAVGAEARGISLGMKHGFAYSDNQFTALATQFMSFQHKAMLAIAGNNKYFSPKDRVGLALTGTLMWGTTFLGLKNAFDSLLAKNGIEKDKQTPIMKEAIEVAQSGLMEKMLNGVLKSAGIDDMKIDWASRFSVFNIYQNDLIKTALAIFGGEKQIGVDILFGATGSTFGGMQDMLNTMSFVNQTTEMDNKDWWTMQLKAASTFMPSMSRVFQWQVAKNTGLLPNAKATYFTEASFREASMYALTGLQTKERAAHFEVMDMSESSKKKSAESDAKTIYESMATATTILSAEDLTPELYSIYDKRLKASYQYIGETLSKVDPFYRASIEKELGRLIERDPKRGKDSLLYRLGLFYSTTGMDGQQSLYQLNKIRNKADELRLDQSERDQVDAIITYYKESLEAFNNKNQEIE